MVSTDHTLCRRSGPELALNDIPALITIPWTPSPKHRQRSAAKGSSADADSPLWLTPHTINRQLLQASLLTHGTGQVNNKSHAFLGERNGTTITHPDLTSGRA